MTKEQDSATPEEVYTSLRMESRLAFGKPTNADLIELLRAAYYNQDSIDDERPGLTTKYWNDNFGQYMTSSGIARRFQKTKEKLEGEDDDSEGTSGGWAIACESAGVPHGRPDLNRTDDEWFEQLRRIWIKIGHSPSYPELATPAEYESADGSFETVVMSPGGFMHRFGSIDDDGTRKMACMEDLYEKFFDWHESSRYEPGELKIANDDVIVNPSPRQYGPLSASERKSILERDNYTCGECGASRKEYEDVGHDLVLEVHHKDSQMNGGSKDPANLETLCKACHLKSLGR